MFVLNGGSYAVSAPVWGHLCDRPSVHPLAVNAAGAGFILAGFTLLGPAPFLPGAPPTLLSTCMAGLFLHGVGVGAMLVSSFSASQRGALAAGFADGMETYGMISGMWSSVFALGESERANAKHF